jgi:ribosomal protein S18 acetylase RimI-like enzyme
MQFHDPILNLRAEREGDATFLAALYRSTREDLLQLGLPQVMLEGLLDMQFRAQQAGYRSQFPGARYHILEKAGEPVGGVLVHDGEEAMRLVYIAILPQERKLGHGRRLIAAVQAEAARANKPLKLSVMAHNLDAQRLYLACGFLPAGGDGVNLEMRWNGPAART